MPHDRRARGDLSLASIQACDGVTDGHDGVLAIVRCAGPILGAIDRTQRTQTRGVSDPWDRRGGPGAGSLPPQSQTQSPELGRQETPPAY